MRRVSSLALSAWLDWGAVAVASESPWNGWWKLYTTRSEPGGAADDYRFAIAADEGIKWRIPSLKQHNTGMLKVLRSPSNGPAAMPGWRCRCAPRDRALGYTVASGGKIRGAGLMTLVEDGRTWTDAPLETVTGEPAPSLTIVHVRRAR